MRPVFQATDGKIFETEKECQDYEEFKKSKPKIITDWLAKNIMSDIEELRLYICNQDEDEETDWAKEKVEEYSELIETINYLGEQEKRQAIIKMNKEILSLLSHWEAYPEEASAAALTIGLLKDMETKTIATLRKAIDIFINAYFSTNFEQSLPLFPSANKLWSGADFTSSMYLGQRCLNCRHWDAEDKEQPFVGQGKCTRLAPSEKEFPITSGLDRCGEWEVN